MGRASRHPQGTKLSTVEGVGQIGGAHGFVSMSGKL
jgi:hypothetical protein